MSASEDHVLITAVRALQGVQTLHRRGFHRIRILPGLNASGSAWRVVITTAENLGPKEDFYRIRDERRAVFYSSAGGPEFGGGVVTAGTPPQEVADLILRALPGIEPADDPAYVGWFAGLMEHVGPDTLPIAYADYFDDSEGWLVGPSRRYPVPPVLGAPTTD
jgi:O-acetyl-ADP-ribose deacetylase